MSWCEAMVGRHWRGAVALLLLAALGACGFQPLYGRTAEAPSRTVNDLALIRIATIIDRPGQQLHNFLRDRLNPLGQPTRPRYLLVISVTETEQEFGVAIDETATRANLRLSAAYKLTDYETRAHLTAGTSQSVNSFNILSNEFATYTAEEDARKRGLREIADDIKARLSIYFFNAQKKTS